MNSGIRQLQAVAILATALGMPSSSGAQTPPAGPAPSASVQVNPRAGDASDGKAFRILSRITKAVAPAILFQGRIARSVVLGKTRSGATSVCANCTDGRGADAVSAKGDTKSSAAVAPDAGFAGGQPPLGYALVMDTSNDWNPRFEDGGFLYVNDEGYDSDYRYYEAFPAADPTTVTGTVGKLLWVCSTVVENQKASPDAAQTFQLFMRRFRTTYAAPLTGGSTEPRKFMDGEPGSEEVRGLAKSRLQKPTQWLPPFRPRFELRQEASRNALTDAIALFATSGDQFAMILDLRTLESKQAGYFWAPYDHGQRIVLDESDLTVDGGADAEDGYAPDILVEYPYLLVSGEYARFALSRGQGSLPVQMVVGSCDECPQSAVQKLP